MAPYGCGLGGDVAINLTVSAMSPAAGSAAGGHKLMITGSGKRTDHAWNNYACITKRTKVLS